MAGFETGNSQGIHFHAKQFGSILRGSGPPVPAVGVVGDLYIDVVTWQLFEKRDDIGLDPWGHYLFIVPALYRMSLMFFGTSAPPNDLGAVGAYYMQWGGYPNYGMNLIIFGPKLWTGWPENGDGPTIPIAPGAGTSVLPVGTGAEGATLLDKQPSQLIAVGLLDEYTIPVPVTSVDGDPILQVGVQSSGTETTVTPNSRYTAEDSFAVA